MLGRRPKPGFVFVDDVASQSGLPVPLSPQSHVDSGGVLSHPVVPFYTTFAYIVGGNGILFLLSWWTFSIRPSLIVSGFIPGRHILDFFLKIPLPRSLLAGFNGVDSRAYGVVLTTSG